MYNKHLQYAIHEFLKKQNREYIISIKHQEILPFSVNLVFALSISISMNKKLDEKEHEE
jgi:hypothetical protein